MVLRLGWTTCAAFLAELHFVLLHLVTGMNLLDYAVQSERVIWLRETLNSHVVNETGCTYKGCSAFCWTCSQQYDEVKSPVIVDGYPWAMLLSNQKPCKLFKTSSTHLVIGTCHPGSLHRTLGPRMLALMTVLHRWIPVTAIRSRTLL